MAVYNVILIASLRLALFITCRLTVLPLLLGEARHASLDETDANGQYELNQLPAPATTYNPNSRNGVSLATKARNGLTDWKGMIQSLKDPHQASSHVFSLCFEESTILFALVLLEATGRLSTQALRRNWTFSLISVVILAALLIPLCICLLITFRISSATPLQRVLFAIPAFVIWSIIFVNVPLPAALAHTTGLLDAALARMALLGVILIGILSGSAAASSAYDTYEAFFAKRKPRPVTASEVQGAESSFKRTCADLAARRRQLDQVRNAPANPNDQTGLLGRMWGSSQRSKEIKSLSQEIFGLETLATAMRDDLDKLKTRHRDGKWATTIQGKILLGAGHLFSIYCVWRVLLAALSLAILGYKEQAPPDFVSLSLAYLVKFVNVNIDLAAWTRLFGLLFVGALIVIRMRFVLANLSTFFRAASTGISTSFLVLFLAEVLTIYLLATLIQLRVSLPSKYSGEIPEPSTASVEAAGDIITSAIAQAGDAIKDASRPLLATLPSFNVVFGSAFDGTFLISAIATGAWRWYSSMDDLEHSNW